MIQVPFVMLLCFFYLCQATQPAQNGALYQRRYDIREEAADNGAGGPYPYERTFVYPRSLSDQNQYNLNQYPQFNQLQPLNHQQQQSQQLDAPQQDTQQYLAALQQYYAASRKPQTTSPYNQVAPTQQYPLPVPASSPQNYQHPLGVLYSAATDVSQFQFSGNGVNYSF